MDNRSIDDLRSIKHDLENLYESIERLQATANVILWLLTAFFSFYVCSHLLNLFS